MHVDIQRYVYVYRKGRAAKNIGQRLVTFLQSGSWCLKLKPSLQSKLYLVQPKSLH